MGGSEPGSAVATEIGDDSVWDLLDMNYEVRVGLGEVEEPSAEAEIEGRRRSLEEEEVSMSKLKLKDIVTEPIEGKAMKKTLAFNMGPVNISAEEGEKEASKSRPGTAGSLRPGSAAVIRPGSAYSVASSGGGQRVSRLPTADMQRMILQLANVSMENKDAKLPVEPPPQILVSHSALTAAGRGRSRYLGRIR